MSSSNSSKSKIDSGVIKRGVTGVRRSGMELHSVSSHSKPIQKQSPLKPKPTAALVVQVYCLFDIVPAARKIPKIVEQQRPPISERIQLVRKRGRPIITLDGRKLTLSGSGGGGRKLNIGGKGVMKKGKGGGRGLSILERISF
uniref:Uncharacterized protein n=1 Tax=Meloidogyne javanica TaxID=6303 RepID=A0A915MX16_MELJA